MTLVAAAFYPHIINESYSNTPEGIIFVSDSRLTYIYNGEFFDVAQKIHQFSSDTLLAYANNVKLAQEVIKTIDYTLNTKRKYYNGYKEFLELISNTIRYKKSKLGDDYDTDFLVSTVNDPNGGNFPELYYYSSIFNNDYSPIFISPSDKLKIIGQNFEEREKLKSLIYVAISEFKANEFLSCGIAMRKAMKDYIESSIQTRIGRQVGGLIQSMSIKSNPQGVELINAMIMNPDGEVLEITRFDEARKRWLKESKGELAGYTHKYPSEQI